MSTITTEKTGGLPRSALRHRPIAPDVQEFIIPQPRSGKEKKRTSRLPASPLSPVKQAHSLAIIGLSMLTTLILLWAVQGIWLWGSTQLDTLRYGYPRTTYLDRAVGHEIGTTVSHFEALNIQGQIYILEIPGGDAGASHLLVGPHLFGPDADLAPVHLSFLGNSQHPDLLIEVHGIEARFHNTGKTYVPA